MLVVRLPRLLGPLLRWLLPGLWLLGGAVGASAADAPHVLRIVGGLAGVNQYTRHEEPFWSNELKKLSNGAVTAEIVAFDRAGIRGPDMLRLVQVGAVPFGTALLSLSAVQDPEIAAPDLAGLNGDLPTLRKTLAAFRPYLQQLLRTRYGIELLALYVYPAQVTWCTRPLERLADLAGRRVRVSSPAQAHWVGALGGIPVQAAFAELVANVKSGNIDCAITGTMSGNTIGLHQVTSHIHTLPVNWGVSAFVANGAAWAALPGPLRALLGDELPRLENAIWQEAASETAEGIACNTGRPTCRSGQRGSMVEVRESAADAALRRDLFANHVLPGWIGRCGARCAAVWRTTLAEVTGIPAP